VRVITFFYIVLFITFFFFPKKAFAGCTTVSSHDGCAPLSWIGCGQHGGTNAWRNIVYLNAGDCGADGGYMHQTWYWCDPGSSPCSGGSCFTSDTKISTPDGVKDIKDLKEGDVVKSFDPDTGKITESTVTDPYSKVSDHIYTITTSDGSVVKTTAEHPFYVGTESDQLPVSTSLKIKSFLTRMKIYWVSGIHVLKTSF